MLHKHQTRFIAAVLGILSMLALLKFFHNIALANDKHDSAAVSAEVTKLMQRPESSLSADEKWLLEAQLAAADDLTGPLRKKAYTSFREECWSTAAPLYAELVQKVSAPSFVLLTDYGRLESCYERMGLPDKAEDARRSALVSGENLLANAAGKKWASGCYIYLTDFYLRLSRPQHKDLDRCDQVIELLSAAQQSGDLKVNGYDILLRRSRLSNRKGEWEKAIGYANDSLEASPPPYYQALALYERGAANATLNRVKARSDFQKSLDLLARENSITAQLKGVDAVGRLHDLGERSLFSSETFLASVFLRAWTSGKIDLIRQLCGTANGDLSDTQWHSVQQTLEQLPQPGKLIELSTAQNDSSVALEVTTGSGDNARTHFLTFVTAKRGDGFVVKQLIRTDDKISRTTK